MVKTYGDENRYWLGSSYCTVYYNHVNWGLYYVYASGYVGGGNTYFSFGYVGTPSCGIRPVISIKSDIKLEASYNLSQTYEIK